MKLRRVLTSVGCYLALLLVAIFISAVYWQYRVNGILYYCTSPFYIEFFAGPQFAHLNQTPLDHYLAPANRVAHLWDAANATELFAFFETRYNRNHPPQGFGVAFSPDGKRLATSFGANAIKVRKLAD